MISIVVPSLGETQNLRRNILPLSGLPGLEIIVVEAALGTLPLEGLIWIRSPRKNRGFQMNLGAKEAKGQLLVFLHADTLVTPKSLLNVYRVLSEKPHYVGGAFSFALDSPSFKARIIEFGVKLRELLFKLPYGDQALFVWKDIFDSIGGFREVPILEDVLLIQALKKRGRLLFYSEKAVTSARRWEKEGYLKTTFKNWSTMIRWKLYGQIPLS